MNVSSQAEEKQAFLTTPSRSPLTARASEGERATPPAFIKQMELLIPQSVPSEGRT